MGDGPCAYRVEDLGIAPPSVYAPVVASGPSTALPDPVMGTQDIRPASRPRRAGEATVGKPLRDRATGHGYLDPIRRVSQAEVGEVLTQDESKPAVDFRLRDVRSREVGRDPCVKVCERKSTPPLRSITLAARTSAARCPRA